MNLKQKIALLIGIIIIVLMGIYPPWCDHYGNDATGRTTLFTGYSLFTIPPEYSVDIHYVRLVFQWAMVVIVTGGFLLIFKDKKKSSDNLPISR